MKREDRETRDKKIIALYYDRCTQREIAKQVGFSKSMVNKVLKKHLKTQVQVKTDPKPLINVNSLRHIAIYLESIKHGRGNILPLGTADLDNLWVAISLISRNGLSDSCEAEKNRLQSSN